MIRRIAELVVTAVWLASWYVVVEWFLTQGSYLNAFSIGFFVAGLGTGIAARSLLAPAEQHYSARPNNLPDNVIDYKEAR